MTEFLNSEEILDNLQKTFGAGTFHEVDRDEGIIVICFYVDEKEEEDANKIR